MSLLELKDVQVRLNNKTLLHSVNMTVNEHEIVGLVGPTGSGKSTLGKGILHLSNAELDGEVLFLGKNLSILQKEEMQPVRGEEIGIVFQDASLALNPVIKIRDQIVERMVKHHKITRDEAYVRAVDLLFHVGLDNPIKRLEQYPKALSGGMKQRVLIAIALSCKPKLLIADEATSSLDVNAIRRLFQYLKMLPMAVLFISHDRKLINTVSDRIYSIVDDTIVEGNSPLLPTDVPDGKGPSNDIIIRAKGVTQWTLHDFNTTFHKGEIVGLTGPNGSGKSTLAKILLRLQTPTRGQVVYSHELKRQMIFQHPPGSFNPYMKLRDSLLEPLKLNPENPNILNEITDALHIGKKELESTPRRLSGGELQRMSFARAFMTPLDFLVLDEPFTSLDPKSAKKLLHFFLEKQREQHFTTLFISHDQEMLQRVCHRVIELR